MQMMAARWGALTSELDAIPAPADLGLSCQASAVAVTAAHADVKAFRAMLATRVGNRGIHVTEAGTRYIANDADSRDELAAVAPPVAGV